MGLQLIILNEALRYFKYFEKMDKKMDKKIYILNGPNLNLLGHREPEIYGKTTLDEINNKCHAISKEGGYTTVCLQSNSEGQLVDWIQEAIHEASAIIINPGAYGHTSVALLDALNAFKGQVAEVHISNIHQREKFRHHSYISSRADFVILGLGAYGYEIALKSIINAFLKT